MDRIEIRLRCIALALEQNIEWENFVQFVDLLETVATKNGALVEAEASETGSAEAINNIAGSAIHAALSGARKHRDQQNMAWCAHQRRAMSIE